MSGADTPHIEVRKLRADLERVTAEWDRAKRLEPYCDRLAAELAETKAALELLSTSREAHAEGLDAVEQERDAARAELAQLQRAWALQTLEQYREAAPAAERPESVAALIRAGAGLPIGECDRCKRRAPVTTKDLAPRVATGQMVRESRVNVCAKGWGCSEKG